MVGWILNAIVWTPILAFIGFGFANSMEIGMKLLMIGALSGVFIGLPMLLFFLCTRSFFFFWSD